MTFIEFISRLDEIPLNKWGVLFFLVLSGISVLVFVYFLLVTGFIFIREHFRTGIFHKDGWLALEENKRIKIKKSFIRAIMGYMALVFFLFLAYTVQ